MKLKRIFLAVAGSGLLLAAALSVSHAVHHKDHAPLYSWIGIACMFAGLVLAVRLLETIPLHRLRRRKRKVTLFIHEAD